MSVWKTEQILQEQIAYVEEATKGWSADQLREKLSHVLAAAYPIRYVLGNIIQNPYNEGQVVISGLWPDTFGKERDDLEEPWGAVYNPEAEGKWDYVSYKWSEPLPERIQLQEARFPADMELHPDTKILSVWQYHTACSINGGSFDRTDVETLVSSCRFTKP